MRSAFFIFVLAIGILLSIQGKARAGEQPESTNVYGWAWVGAADVGGPPTYGWLSVNCNNFVNGALRNRCGASEYGLRVDPETGDISGFAWVQNLGWIDFQPNPFPADSPNHALRGEPRDGINPSNVSGWFTNETLATYGLDKVQKPDWGWMLAQEGGSPNGAWWDYSVGTPELRGWMWSGGGTDATGYFDHNIGLGWMSMNCKDAPDGCSRSTYAVKYDGIPDAQGKVDLIGYAWIGAPLGWVSFSCKNDEALGDSNYCETVSDYQVKYNQKTGVFTGFAYIGGGEGGGMWLNNISGAFPDYPQHSARFFFQDTPADPDDPYDTVDHVADYQAGQVAGWARVLSLKDYGITKLGVPSLGWVQLRGNWATENPQIPNQRGVAIDFDSGAISGYAWGGSTNNTYKDFGPGWIQFSGQTGLGAPFSPTYQAPYVTAQEGNIYAQKSVGIDTDTTRESFAPPADRYNATYLIQSSGDIVHYQSENKGLDAIENLTLPLDTPLTFPQAGNRYRNVLGNIDITALTTKVDGDKNRFGHELEFIDKIQSSDVIQWDSEKLEGKIYVITPSSGTTFTIDESYEWKNGQNTKNGAGLVIVNGDLVITENIAYEPGVNLPNIVNLASIAWIVLGDITIDPGVTNLAGAYIALGTETGEKGALSTGLSVTQPLTVSGLLMARAFTFERQYIGAFDDPKPAETVIYDGRLHANVPPGLEDFTAGFPVLRDSIP